MYRIYISHPFRVWWNTSHYSLLQKVLFWRNSKYKKMLLYDWWAQFLTIQKVTYSVKSSTWASVNTRKAYISVSGANPGHSASWPAITPATNVPCPRLSFNVSSFVQFVRSYKISLLNNVFTLLEQNKESWEMWYSRLQCEFKFVLQ